MSWSKLENSNIKLDIRKSKLETSHFKLEMSKSKFDMSQSKYETLRSIYEKRRSKCATRRIKYENKLRLCKASKSIYESLKSKCEKWKSKFETSHFKSAISRSRTWISFRKLTPLCFKPRMWRIKLEISWSKLDTLRSKTVPIRAYPWFLLCCLCFFAANILRRTFSNLGRK